MTFHVRADKMPRLYHIYFKRADFCFKKKELNAVVHYSHNNCTYFKDYFTTEYGEEECYLLFMTFVRMPFLYIYVLLPPIGCYNVAITLKFVTLQETLNSAMKIRPERNVFNL